MSESMIERVARALCAQEIRANSLTGEWLDFANVVDCNWKDHVAQATTAIEAMRGLPTREMILAGYNALMEWDARTGEDHGMREIWEAMIDAALNPLGDAG